MSANAYFYWVACPSGKKIRSVNNSINFNHTDPTTNSNGFCLYLRMFECINSIAPTKIVSCPQTNAVWIGCVICVRVFESNGNAVCRCHPFFSSLLFFARFVLLFLSSSFPSWPSPLLCLVYDVFVPSFGCVRLRCISLERNVQFAFF